MQGSAFGGPVACLIGDIHFNVVHTFRQIIGIAARKFQQIRIHRNLHEQMRLAVICGDKLLHGVICRLAWLIMNYRNGYTFTIEFQGNFIRIVAVLHFQKNEMLLRAIGCVLKRDFAGNMDYSSSHDGVAAVMIHVKVAKPGSLGNRVNLHMQLVRAFGNACAPIRNIPACCMEERIGHMNLGDGDIHIIVVVVVAGDEAEFAYASVWVFGFYGNNNLVADNILGDSNLVRCAAHYIVGHGTAVGRHGVFKGD